MVRASQQEYESPSPPPLADPQWNLRAPLEPSPRLHNEPDTPQHYHLTCPACGATFEDDGYRLECTACPGPSLLQARYTAQDLAIRREQTGLDRYRSWLPVRRSLAGSSSTVTYRSQQLCSLTGLPNLWIAFNGFWPERNARLLSGSFKELEAFCVLARLPSDNRRTMVIASAGNTAAAFARIASLHQVPCLIVIPQSGLDCMLFDQPIDPCIQLVTITGNGDYADAIRLGQHASALPGFFAEGGARNVARRAGLGTVLLNAFETIGRLPHYYFQAIGSGTGAIAVHEYARQLAGPQGTVPRLYLSQNTPFTPIYNAWSAASPICPSLSEPQAKRQIAKMDAQVLANRNPPYTIRGGLYEALLESRGSVLAVTNAQARHAAQLFQQTEAIDIEPAAAVAFASLLAQAPHIPPGAAVLLNITGGGRQRFRNDRNPTPIRPSLSIAPEAIDSPATMQQIAALF